MFDNDDQFSVPGWDLDISWYLSLSSAVVCMLAAIGMTMAAYVLPQEDGYEFLEDPLDA